MTARSSETARQVVKRLDAAGIYETARIQDLWMDGTEDGIHLFRGEVVENDGPGAGRCDDLGVSPFLEIAGPVLLRKTLCLDDPRTVGAQVAFIGRERRGHGATLRFRINGVEVLRAPSPIATPEARQYWELAPDEGAWSWSRWYYVAIPPSALRKGENEIRLESVDGRLGWDLMVADHRSYAKGMADPVSLPRSSSLSRDNGRSWGPERGEYVIRLILDRYRKTGELVSGVLDAAGQEDAAVKGRRSILSLSTGWDADSPEGTSLAFHVRTGPGPVFEPATWSDWLPCANGGASTVIRGRYAQWKASFASTEPGRTPLLRGVQLTAAVREEGGGGMPRVVRAENARILRPSRDFPWERFDCEPLRELRRRFELDAVMAGAATEFERIERLMAWAYHVPLHQLRHFPWDVLRWVKLERAPDGAIRVNEYTQRRRDAMCLYPNVVLVAACLSVGIPARHVNFHSEGMTGHEIAEAWSNDYRKWVHLDATRDYYWYDPATRIPLDTLEIHRVLVDRLEQVERWDRPYLFRQDLEALTRDLPIAFREGNHPFSVADGARFLFRSFCHFRTIPRFDVFSRQRPLPVSQGTEVWAWDGYLNWADDRVPPLPHFTRHTNRRADFYPACNQTRWTLERSAGSGELRVILETDTPDFAGYLARIDGGAWGERPDIFPWSLHPGLNLLEVRSRNRAGLEGITSAVALEA